MWEDSETLRQLAFLPSVAHCASCIMGVPSVRVLQDQSNTKPPHGAPTHVHQDHPYLPVAEPLTVAAWVPLCPGGSRWENGRMGYVGGSHRSGLKWIPFMMTGADSEPPEAMEVWPTPEDDPQRSILTHPLVEHLPTTFVSVPPRAVAFHHGLMLHTSQPNTTDTWRHAYTTTYCAADVTAGSCMVRASSSMLLSQRVSTQTEARVWAQGYKIKQSASHYMLRSGLHDGDRSEGPGCDEHMPVAWPVPASLPTQPKVRPKRLSFSPQHTARRRLSPIAVRADRRGCHSRSEARWRKPWAAAICPSTRGRTLHTGSGQGSRCRRQSFDGQPQQRPTQHAPFCHELQTPPLLRVPPVVCARPELAEQVSSPTHELPTEPIAACGGELHME